MPLVMYSKGEQVDWDATTCTVSVLLVVSYEIQDILEEKWL